ncbi:MAG: hypothetical protein CML66_25155 [Rhodobacteraceae bacterium]|nr:hypothetical protein [Paracoccaceae bacterium]
MRRFALIVPMLAAACTTQQDVASTGRARFPDFPEPLYAAFQSACEGPAQSYNRPEKGVAECRELLPPETTAAIIVSYDGTLDKLPELVIRFTTTQPPDGAGYLVQNDIYLNVPRRNAGELQGRLPDPRLSQTIDALYRKAGGTPE